MRNDFPSSNNLLKVVIKIVWLETSSNHHQLLYTLIFGEFNIFKP